MRRGRRKGASKDKVFGCDLLEHLAASSQEIPLVLRCCSEFIEEYGIVDGIYRLSGVSSNTQKLRGEFDTEGVPDLSKDVYRQDIHCVSSLCKAYFRELPNPLLTYQLYDKFADAVAIQLEEERLVKIREVLKDLPLLHYRTLEYLMRHLVKMATYASETNMHARNLAIVWAPNLLRSKDIEATGLNGTAAFMEVRVQSIVVEFILTHVTQLFPAPGQVPERRKSLPSPSILSNQEDPFFRAFPFNVPSALGPGNGPPAMRPYHAIIEGTDKRKGSLKGRKWKSIFNLGGRLQDPRRKNKTICKDKEKVGLRPAKSMDSLSSVPYTPEGTRQLPSSSPLTQPSPTLSREPGSAGGGLGGAVGGASSGYTVTYRRGGGASVGVVSGGGVQGTYSRLDSGEGTKDSLPPQPRSPTISSRAERPAGMHISEPFSVTVPLHITSGLALGVLKGGALREEGGAQSEEGRANRKEGGGKGKVGRAKGKEGMVNIVDSRASIDEGGASGNEGGASGDEGGASGEEGGTSGEEAGANVDEGRANVVEGGAQREIGGSDAEESGEGRSEEKRKRDESREGGSEGKETEVKWLEESRESGEEGMLDGFSVEETEPVKAEAAEEELEYMDMRGIFIPEEQDSQLPLDFQDTFGFLDLMDSSAYNQVNEFSVEPPCYDEMDDDDNNDDEESGFPGESSSVLTSEQPAQAPQTHRPLTSDLHGHCHKSHSLPYKSRPFMPALSSSSEEEDDEGEEEGSDEEGDMLFYSLPSSLQFQIVRQGRAEEHKMATADAEPGQNTDTVAQSSSNADASGQSEGELEHGVDTDWLVAHARQREIVEQDGSEEDLSVEQRKQLEEERETPTNVANGERGHTVALTNNTHGLGCCGGESGFAASEEEKENEEHCVQEVKEKGHTAEHSNTEPKKGDHTSEHSNTEPNKEDHTSEHSNTEPNKEDHTSEHSNTEPNKEDHTAEHSNTEPNKEDHTAEHSSTEPNKEDHTAEHSSTELNKEDHTSEHSNTEPNKEDHMTEHSNTEPNMEDHTAEHSNTEPNREDHTSEHSNTEPNKEDHTAEHSNTEPNKKDHTAEHSNTEPNKEDHTAEHSNTEPNKEDHTAEHSNTEPNKEDHTAEHSNTEPNKEDHTAEHSNTEPNKEDHTAEHSNTVPKKEDHTVEHAEPKERDHAGQYRELEERDHTAEHSAKEQSEMLQGHGGPGGTPKHESVEDPEGEGCFGDSVDGTKLAVGLMDCCGIPLPLPEPPGGPPPCAGPHQEPPATPEQEDTLREEGGEREQDGGREGGAENDTEGHHHQVQKKEENERKREESQERNVTSGGLEERTRERHLGTVKESVQKHQAQLNAKEKDGERSKEGEGDREQGVTPGRCVREGSSPGLGPGVGRTLVYSKQATPKVHQAKAVPVVPPKPQLSKLTALTLRQQRERERGREGEGDRDREWKREGERAHREEQGKEEQKRREVVRGKDGGNEDELERWGDDGRSAEKEAKRNSGASLCFDVAVARATEKRGKERERGKDGQTESRRGAEKD